MKNVYADGQFVAMFGGEGSGSSDVYTIEQGSTQTLEDTQSFTAIENNLYMFFTGNHSGVFTNADVLVGSTSYFEIVSGIGIAVAIIKANSTSVSYDGGYTEKYYVVEMDILKNGTEDLSIECFDKSNVWTSTSSISANIGEYFLIADTVNNDGGTVVGADVLIEETITHPVQTALNVKIRIVKATASAISLSSGNNLYYRKFGLVKEV